MASSLRRTVVPVLAALYALTFALHLATIARTSHEDLVRRLPDDAFYYLQIARHLADADGFTFDGIHRTNGFHLLWQLLLVPLASVFEDGDQLARAALVIGLVLVYVAALLLVRLAAKVVGPGWALVAGLVAVHGAVGFWVNGMEGPAVLFALALLATALAAVAREPSTGRCLVLGAVTAGAVLARFDVAAVVPIVPLAVGLRLRRWRPVLLWVAGAAAVGLPLLMWWTSLWGFRPLTTSAVVKADAVSDYVHQAFGSRWSSDYAEFLWRQVRSYALTITRTTTGSVWPALDDILLAVVCALMVIGVWSLRGRLRRPVAPEAWALVVLGLIVLAKLFTDLLTAPLWAESWYSAPQRLVLGLAVAALAILGVRALLARSRPVGILAGLALVPLVIPLGVDLGTDDREGRRAVSWQGVLDSTADWIEAEGPPGRYGAYDAGLLGFRLGGDQPVVNLDGLVNDYPYAELVTSGAPTVEKLRATGIDYLVNRLPPESLTGELACSREVWRSPERIPYADAFTPRREDPVYVLDVRPCTR